jgi:hypothetical protein
MIMMGEGEASCAAVSDVDTVITEKETSMVVIRDFIRLHVSCDANAMPSGCVGDMCGFVRR